MIFLCRSSLGYRSRKSPRATERHGTSPPVAYILRSSRTWMPALSLISPLRSPLKSHEARKCLFERWVRWSAWKRNRRMGRLVLEWPQSSNATKLFVTNPLPSELLHRPAIQFEEKLKRLSFRGTLRAPRNPSFFLHQAREIPHFVRNDDNDAFSANRI